MKIPIVSLVGRPNVGKSTLFNKIIGARLAITAEEAGTTRDRLFHKVQHPVMDFFLVDTGGLEFGKGETSIEDDMQTQSRIAIDESDLILFVVEGGGDFMPQDYAAAELLRGKANQKPVFLVASKCDRPLDEAEEAAFYRLGLGGPHQVSAFHKSGLQQLIGEIVETLGQRHFLTKAEARKQVGRAPQGDTPPDIALVGKPNVGKSSLINALLNKDKLIVSPIPGTTRDSTDSLVIRKGKGYNFIDTAGLKRAAKTEMGIEKFSALRSMSSIERCDVALLVLDSSQPISNQDQHIARYIVEAGRGLVILANKWDIKGSEENDLERRKSYTSRLKKNFPFLSWAPVVFTSATTKKNLTAVFDQIDLALEERKRRIPTAQLNSLVQQMVQEHAPTGKSRTIPKLYYITQVETNPPHFVIFVNRKSAFHFSYLRYLENRLRERFAFTGTPVVLEYKEKERDEDSRFSRKRKG